MPSMNSYVSFYTKCSLLHRQHRFIFTSINPIFSKIFNRELTDWRPEQNAVTDTEVFNFKKLPHIESYYVL